MALTQLAGESLFICPEAGACLADDRALSDLIGELFSAGARVVAIPLARLGPDFLRLGSGVAGAVLQKLVNYRFQVAVVGDVAAPAAASGPLRDFIGESNRGRAVWFVADIAELAQKLAATGQGQTRP